MPMKFPIVNESSLINGTSPELREKFYSTPILIRSFVLLFKLKISTEKVFLFFVNLLGFVSFLLYSELFSNTEYASNETNFLGSYHRRKSLL